MAPKAAFTTRSRTLVLTWIGLLVLMLASLGSAYLRLGAANMVIGLVIAAVKAALVVWLFMRLKDAGPLIRLVAFAGVGVLGILFVLSSVDYLTRVQTPAALQRPQTLPTPTSASPWVSCWRDLSPRREPCDRASDRKAQCSADARA